MNKTIHCVFIVMLLACLAFSVKGAGVVTINEVMAKNVKTLATATGVKGLDWVEIRNTGSQAVDLSGWYLGNDPTKKTDKWPVIKGSCIVPANGYKIVWCDGDGACKNWSANEAHVACNISTEAGKHTVFLASAADRSAIVSQVPLLEGLEDVSYGYASATDDFRCFTTPTPGAANASTGRVGFTPKVVFSEPHGYKSASFRLSLSCPAQPKANIYYTLNGKQPKVGGSGSTLYTGPITVSKTAVVRAAVPDSDCLHQRDTSATYLFISDILKQSSSTRPEGFPSGGVNGQSISYSMRAASALGDTDAATATARLYNGFTNGIRTISFVFDPDDYFGSTRGIYVNAHKEGENWERQTLVEQICPVNTNDEFSAVCGVRIRGAYSRLKSYPKHGFRLFFREEYGMGSLNHPLFGDEGPDSFGKIDLRCEQNSSWSNNQSDNTMVHEVFSRDTQRDMGQPYNKSRYYHLFFNGCYWGVYQTEERVDQKYCADNVGGKAENYDVVRTSNVNNGSAATYQTGVVEGDAAAWQALWNISMKEGYGAGHEANYYKVRGLNSDGTRNPAYPIYLNVTNLICFLLTSQYTADADSPANIYNMPNNIIAYRNRVEGDGDIEGFLWNRHDPEQSLGHGEFGSTVSAGTNFLLFGTRKNGKTALADFNPQMLHYELCSNPEYKRTFADLVQKIILAPGGVMSPEACKARYRARMAQIDDAVMAELARWGKSWTRSTWVGNCNKDLSFFDQRTSYLLRNYRDASLKWFPSIDAVKVLDLSARQIADGEKLGAGDRVYLTGTNAGTVYYTTDGSDPCLPSGGVSPKALVYDGDSSGIAYRTVIRHGDEWKYSDTGAKPAANWFSENYSDASWKSGASKLGFAGSGTFGHSINRYLNGASSGTQVTTYYFRRTFKMPAGAEKLASLRADIDCDDGYIVYINGVEVKKDQVASSEYSAFSTATNMDRKEIDWTFAAGLLREGLNTIAVEVHQCNATSSDAWWSLGLTYPDVSSATGGIVIPPKGLKIMARVKTSTEWSALSEVGIKTDVQKVFTGVYNEPVRLETDNSFVLSNAHFKAGLVIADGITAKLKAATNTVNTVKSIAAAKAEVRFTGDGTVKLEGANTLMTVSNLVVKSGTFSVKSTGVSTNRTPVVNVLGFVEQTGGVIEMNLGITSDRQVYGIYVANKNRKDADGKDTAYALFDGGEFDAVVGATKSSAVYIDKGSVDATFKGGQVIDARLMGKEPRFISASGDIGFKNCKVNVSMPDSSTSGARAFKSDKKIAFNDANGHFVANLGGPDAEIFSAADRIRIDAGTFELVASDDCFSAMTNITVNGGLIYAVSTGNDVFDSNGDMELNGGTILAYATTDGHEAFDVDPEQTESGSRVHQLRVNGGTIFATGGKDAVWPKDLVAPDGAVLYAASRLGSSTYSRKYASLGNSINMITTARLPAFPGANCALLMTCPNMTGSPTYSSSAPSSGSQDFHDLYIEIKGETNQNQLRFLEIYGSTADGADGDTGEYIVLTNISSKVVQLAGVTVSSAKYDSKKEKIDDPKCSITLGVRTIPARGSVRLDQADYLDAGWSKITNGSIFLKLTDALGGVVQSGYASFDNAKYPDVDGGGEAILAIRFDTALKDTTEYWRSTAPAAHAHIWGSSVYVWSPDYTTCTGTMSCTFDRCRKTLTETSSVRFVVTQQATTTATGIGHYEATFANAAFTKQASPDVVIPMRVSGATKSVGFSVKKGTSETGFPVLVKLAVNSPAGFTYADCAADGSDLRFFDADGNPAPSEIDSWNPSGESLVWVRLPSVGTGATFTMEYGGDSEDGNNPADVWAGYTGVWHFETLNTSVKVTNSKGSYANSTATAGIDGNLSGASTAGDVGRFGNCFRVNDAPVPHDKSTNLYKMGGVWVNDSGSNSPVDGGSNFTISGWFKHRNYSYSYDNMFYKRAGATSGDAFAIECEKTGSDVPKPLVRGQGSTGASVDLPNDLVGKWGYMTFVYDGTKCHVYEDGSLVADVTITASNDNNLPLVFGNSTALPEAANYQANSAWCGWIDEVRFSKGTRSAAWIAAEYAAMTSADLLTAGAVRDLTPKSTKVTFDANGGKGTMSPLVMEVGRVYNLPKCLFTAPSGKTSFAGWACSNGLRYDDGILVYNLGNVTMKAIWK